MTKSERDRGQSAIVVLMMGAVLFVAVSTALVVMGTTVIDRTRAQSVADAAALAALDGGPGAARGMAARHGARLDSFAEGPGAFEVTVVIRLGDTTATARASAAP